MIVHDSGDTWQLVQQHHHGVLAGQFAAAWGNADFPPSRRHASLVTAATRHDDGWAVWEQWPRLDAERRPLRFLDVHILAHLDFYRAAITDISAHDPYAGLLVAMHGAGIYRERYGMQPGMRNRWADEYGTEIDAFVAEIEAGYPERMAAAGVDDAERWSDYMLLQAFDRLALYFSGLPPAQPGEPQAIGPVPAAGDGSTADVDVTPLSDVAHAPTHARIAPYGFARSPTVVTVQRRVVGKQAWDEAGFRSACRAAPLETVEIVVER
jgi:hypothetical protein